MQFLATILCLAAFRILSASQAAQPTDNEAARFDAAGREAFRTGRYRDAKRYFERELNSPGSDRNIASFNLGLACKELGELKRAEQLFSSVIQTSPAHGPAWSALGQVQFAQGRDQEAEANFRRAIDLSDRQQALKIKNDLAVLWESRGKRSEAVALLESVITDTTPGRERLRMLTNLGAWQSKLGHHQDSLRSLAAALTEAEATVGPSHPDTAQVLQTLGQALQKAGRKADARQMRQRAQGLTAEFAAQTNAGSATVDVRDLKE